MTWFRQHHKHDQHSGSGSGAGSDAAAATANALASLTHEEQRALFELLPRIIGQLHHEVRRNRDDSTLFLASCRISTALRLTLSRGLGCAEPLLRPL